MQVCVRKESMVKAFPSWKVEGMLPGNPPVPEGVVVRAFLRLLGERQGRENHGLLTCWIWGISDTGTQHQGDAFCVTAGAPLRENGQRSEFAAAL